MADWSAHLRAHESEFLADLISLLRIPSVSTDPERAEDVRHAAEWVADRLRRAGMQKVAVMETARHPVVYGERLSAPGRPTVLFYGHFDVQPPDPLGEWNSPPFEPTLRTGRLYARGASDMKGNLLLPVVACEALAATADGLPVNVKFLYEGEEEIGSPSLAPFVAAHRELLACDLAVSADSGQFSEDRPALLVGLRGMVGVQIDVRSAAADAHSGIFGGLLPNAIHALVRILESMRAADGRVLVDGFYDDVAELDTAERAAMAALPMDWETVRQAAGAKALVGEPGYTPLERNWIRPTLDVNGIWGGFQGAGSKTVIPCEAHAKVGCRLVANQTPGRVRALLREHVLRHAPHEVEVEVTNLAGHADPYLIPKDHPGLRAAERALTQVYGRPPFRTRMGASVPATAILREQLGVWTVPFGFSIWGDEGAHAPNEFVRLSSMEKGSRAFCSLLENLR